MIQAIQQLQQDMGGEKIALLSGLVAFAIVWCWWQQARERRAMARVARKETNRLLPLIEPLADATFATAELVAEHDRALSVLTQDPEQEAIDAAIAEADAEAEEAAEVGWRVIA